MSLITDTNSLSNFNKNKTFYIKHSYTTGGVATQLTIPADTVMMRCKIWGASGGGSFNAATAVSGAGGYVEILTRVSSSDEYWIYVGNRGLATGPNGSTILRGGYNNNSAGGGDGSMLVKNISNIYNVRAIAGGGGGSGNTNSGSPNGGAAMQNGFGFTGFVGIVPQHGEDGIGGSGGTSTNHIDGNECKLEALSLAALGGFGTSDITTIYRSGSGAGYGSGGTADNVGAAGGGNYVPQINSTILYTNELAGSSNIPPKTTDVDYTGSVAAGVGSGINGNPGMIVVYYYNVYALNVYGKSFTDLTSVNNFIHYNFSSIYIPSPIISATNTGITTNNANTLYIDGPPTTGTNQTITSSYALNVNSGQSLFGGNIISKGSLYSESIDEVIIAALNTQLVTFSNRSFPLGPRTSYMYLITVSSYDTIIGNGAYKFLCLGRSPSNVGSYTILNGANSTIQISDCGFSDTSITVSVYNSHATSWTTVKVNILQL